MPTQTFLNLNKEKQDRILNASINEFSEKIFEQVNLSDIIKQAKIPRGSFYQYFKDKEDLYLYLISVISDKKMQYLSSSLKNDHEIPFLDLVKIMFEDGVKFAIEHPKFVKILNLLLNNKNHLYDKLMKENLNLAKHIYKDMINKDKRLGRINNNIDTAIFAELIVNLTTNVSLDNLDLNQPKKSYQTMIDKIEKILNILKKGVQNNE